MAVKLVRSAKPKFIKLYDTLSPNILMQDRMEGVGYIAGTVSIDGLPTADLVVKLYSSESGRLIQTTTTDILGGYRFNNVKIDRPYDVTAQDAARTLEKQISTMRYPVSTFNRGSSPLIRTGEHAVSELLDAPAFSQPRVYAGEYASTFLPGPAFRYVRMYCTVLSDNSTAGYLNLDQIHFREVEGGDNLALRNSASGVGSQSSLYSGAYAAEFAIEGNGLFHTAYQGAPLWATYDFGAGRAYSVNHLTMRPANALAESRAPKNFLVQGSPDNVTWTTLATFTGVTGWVLNVAKTFSW